MALHPNGEVQLLLIVMHGFRKKKCHQLWMRRSRSVLTGVNTREDTLVVWQPQQFHWEAFLLFLPVLLFHLWYFFFFFLFFFNSPGLFQILMVLRLACYYLQLQNKGRLLNSVLQGRAKLFWEACLPTAWVAGLKGGGILLGAKGWESTHCGSFYVVEFIFMQLKEAAAFLVEWTPSEILHLISHWCVHCITKLGLRHFGML